ncbi:hypothetical protein [Limosilactobacillus secaliphilus]|uniref:Uncharacterized protein n=1 Tax=Limosilactobacillus secaliphilus TaxID=396268 RepID=A0A0R2I409_9LACO|nr:hypothetical protein [Limosilactobacillus secaliphilus]KRN58326.1 hypothetical protein IV45_GL000771 [Limosilactobacillus secaliphilus]
MKKKTKWQRFKRGLYVNFFDALNIFAQEDKFIHSRHNQIHMHVHAPQQKEKNK